VRGLEALNAPAEGPGITRLPPTEGPATPLAASHLCRPSHAERRSVAICTICSICWRRLALCRTCHGLLGISTDGLQVGRCLHKGWLAGPYFHRFFTGRRSWSIPESANPNSALFPALLRLRLLAHVSPDGPVGRDHHEARTQIEH
jgi:hypothetical protein